MEIQDRNSLLQQFFGTRANGVSEVIVDDKGFANMLKPQKSDVEKTEKSSDGIVLAKDNKAIKLKEKADVPVKENKKETVEKKSEAKTEEKQEIEKNEKPAQKEKDKEVEGKKETNDATSNQASQPTEDGKKTETSEAVEASDANEDALVVAAAAAGVSQIVVEDVVLVQDNIVENTVASVDNSLLSKDMPMDIVSQLTPVEDGMQVLTEEEALLLEQAKYLDSKLGASKVKVEVEVNEAKIAEPITKDVLQNRFEIDSLFQSVDVEAVEVAEPVLDTEVTPATLDKDIRTSLVDAKGVAFVEVNNETSSTASVVTKNDNVLAISGKDVVAETVNTNRNEAFAKINETSSRDMFKGLGKDVVEQIKVNITKSAVKGIDTIDIQLKPEELGKIQIKMHIAKDGRLQADIISARAETLDMLQKDVSSLAKAFSDAGYDTDSRSFNFSFQEENQAREQQKDNSGLLQFIGDTLEQEAENIAGNDNLGYDPLRGLNIKV